MNQIEVLVREKESQETRTMTYKSWLDLQDRFELIGQCNSEGELIPGDPNLSPRHQKMQVAQENAEPVVSTGIQTMSQEEKMRLKEELIKKYAPKVEEPPVLEPVEQEKPAQKKRGPKPKTAA